VEPDEHEALAVGPRALSYTDLRRSAASLAARLDDHDRVAVWATPSVEACVAVVGALLAGTTAVPLNPKLGRRELEHILGDSRPSAVIAGHDEPLPEPLSAIPRIVPDADASGPDRLPPEPDRERPAFVFYTSGTTGPPKGALTSRHAIASNLDALATAWGSTEGDVLTHGLPLFHVHGLVLGVLGPLRTGGSVRHVGRFDPRAICDQLAGGASMVFGVPTMYQALAEEAERSNAAAAALRDARLLVSGSAGLPVRDWHRIQRSTGQGIVERYGLTETMIICAAPADAERRPGSVGPSLAGVDIRLVDDGGADISALDGETIGEIVVRGPNLFLGYLNLPDATAAAMRDRWFVTGDLATRDADGWLRIVGRRSTDLIKTGGYKVGAGEVEAALLEHPGVAEAAVIGEPDARLGERIVAYVVLTGRPDTQDGADGASGAQSAGGVPTAQDLADHVASLLAPHKRPRDVRFLDRLPRNDMGKIVKSRLKDGGGPV
jgi:malonyl-CoA/methylmalonyl-CoA synthetase